MVFRHPQYTLLGKQQISWTHQFNISPSFEAIKNLSYRSLCITNLSVSARGIRNLGRFAVPILAIQKWQCLSE